MVVDTSTLHKLIDARIKAENEVSAAAITVLRDVLRENGWSAVEVECEGLSMVQKVQDSKTGVWSGLDDELAEDLFDVAGNVPRSVYTWVGGDFDYTVSLAKLNELAA